MDDTRVHDALERLAANAPPSSDAVWERTQQRIARRRRTRVLVTGAVVVALLLGAAGVVAAVGSNNDTNRVAAGPAGAPAPDHVLAVVNGRLEMRSTANGAVERDGDEVPHVTNAFDVATVPGAPYFVYTQQVLIRARTVGPRGSPLVRVRASDWARTIVTDAAALAPTISPDGRLVAYRVANRTTGAVQIAVRDLATLHAATVIDPSSRHYLSNLTETGSHVAKPLAWTPDSKRLLIDDGTGAYVLLGVGMNAPPRLLTTMPDGVTHTVYIDDDKIAIAYRQSGADTDTLAIYYVGSGALRPIAANEALVSATVNRLSFDPTSGTVLATVLDSNGLFGRLVTFNASQSHESSKIYGLTSASWFTAASTAPTTTARATSVTVPNVVGLKADAAERALEAAGLRASPTPNPDRSVLQQDPRAGSVVAHGSTVTLTTCPPSADCVIPIGPNHGGRVVVPDMRGMPLDDATGRLAQLGLVAHPVTDPNVHGAGSNRTAWQDPPPGTTVNVGAGIWVWSCPDGTRCAVPPSTFLQSFHDALGWRAVDANDALMLTVASRRFDTPNAFAQAIAVNIDHSPEAPGNVTYTITNRVTDSAHVWVQTRNMPDDSIDGADYEFVVTRTGNAWTLHDGRVRTICVRGVASVDSCL